MSTSSTDAVFHRRNKQIQDAIDSHSLKQALQLVEKRIKKGEDTRFLRVRDSAIKFYAPQDGRAGSSQSTLLKLEPFFYFYFYFFKFGILQALLIFHWGYCI